MSGNKYVLDSNVFIQAKNTYYGFDLCPGFWTSLLRKHDEKRVCSIDRVKSEIFRPSSDPDHAPDDLTLWVQDKVPATFFKETKDQAVNDAFSRMIQWIDSEPQYTPNAQAEFASVADGWLIAYALVNSLTVVTHEEFAANVARKVPIPNVCLEFEVSYVNTFEMLEDLKVKFILNTKKRRS